MKGILRKNINNNQWFIDYDENNQADVCTIESIKLTDKDEDKQVVFKINFYYIGSGDYIETKRRAQVLSFVDLDTNTLPNYYNSSKITPLNVIDEWGLDFRLGNVVKYIARAGKKDSETERLDLEKALSYLQGKINTIKETKQ